MDPITFNLMRAAGAGGSIVDDYFSKKIYTGTNSAQSVTTDLDMTGGGLTWIKVNNTNNWNHTWAYDENVVLSANKEDSEASGSNKYVTSWTSTGFNIGTHGSVNDGTISNTDVYSWNFKKAEGFFDFVEYNGTSNYPSGYAQNISHSLGQVPGLIIIKRSDSMDWPNTGGDDWNIQFNDWGAGYYGKLNRNNIDQSRYIWDNTAATSTNFRLGHGAFVNGSGRSFKAFLFAKDTDGLIKCSTYAGNPNNDITVTTGFKPQFLLIKKYASSGNGDWMVIDDSMATNGGADKYKEFFEFGNTSSYNQNGAVNSTLKDMTTGFGSSDYVEFTSTGFKVSSSHSNLNSGSNATYFYMAIAAP